MVHIYTTLSKNSQEGAWDVIIKWILKLVFVEGWLSSSEKLLYCANQFCSING